MIRINFGYLRMLYDAHLCNKNTVRQAVADGHITPVQYLERIPDGNIPRRRALIEELKQQAAAAQQAAPAGTPAAGGMNTAGEKPEIPGGQGYGALQRAINRSGSTEGIV